jgi:RsiW-degrading membrane proteinase PrsW (M82 family)
MRCTSCGREVPEGVFCTVCGAHQGTTGQLGDPKARLHHYAAHPGEHVFNPSMFTSLFPHLGRHGVHQFRWAFALGLAAIFILYLAGLITAALLVSIFLIPGLYLLYLYEAQVYRDEPVAVLGFTLGGGLIVGIILTLLTDRLIDAMSGPARLAGGVAALGAGYVLVSNVLVPVIQEVVKPIPALALRGRLKFRETVDGLVFGVAAGFGFSVGETLVRYWNPLSSLPARTDPQNWLVALTTLGVLRALLQGATTGAIVAAIWRLGRGRAAARELGAVVAALVAHIAFDLVSYWLADAGFNGLAVLVWQALIDAALLIAIRYVLHHALLDEAGELGFTQTVCPNCHRHIVAAGFCPNCGAALTAAPAAVRETAAPPSGSEGTSTTEAN